MERRLGSAFVGLASAAAGVALFSYGALFVMDWVIVLGIVLAAGGAFMAVGSAIRAQRRAAVSVVAAIAVLPLAFVIWMLWRLAHETT